jgi:tetratricopeptide (TPR) repeat protein
MSAAVSSADLLDALRARDRNEVNRIAGQLLHQRAPMGEQWFSIAQVLVRNGEIDLAVHAAQRAVDEIGRTAKALFQLANILAMTGRQDDAAAIVATLAPGQIDPVQRNHFLGTCAFESGDFDQARNAFDQVVASWPASGATWLSLAALPAADDLALIERLDAARPAIAQTPADSQARWHYARGTVLDRLGNFDEAFAEFSSGADLVRRERPFDPVSDRHEAERLVTEFSAAAISEIALQVRTASARPILVVGIPRSGTTLVESMLAKHSTIAGGGELPFGSIVSREIGGNSLTALESFVATRDADELTRLYLHLGDQQFGEGKRFVDKCLGNSRDLGVLASILPQAPIIWLRRNPLDCAWSCLRTYFTQGISWSWSQTDIAAHFQAEDLLHAHWQEVLGDRLLTLCYEDVVASPDGQMDRISNHVALKVEALADQERTHRRPVLTASMAQVRQPIYQSAVGAAERYRAHLQPFVAAYEAKERSQPVTEMRADGA